MNHRRHRIVDLASTRPKALLWGVAALTLISVAFMGRIEIDTDPENMLPSDNPARVMEAAVNEDFGIRDMIVVGIVADDTILTVERLAAIAKLEEDVAALDGVIADELVGLSTAVPGRATISSSGDVDALATAVDSNPLLAGNVISADRSAAALFVPLESKGDATGVASEVKSLIAADPALASLDTYQAGLPLAEEEFGRQMFLQMGLLPPLASLLIFGLMLLFFRSFSLVASAMIVAMVTVIWTMGMLIGSGNTVHLMASMVPILLMPIAILDSVHVLSEFFDRYPAIGDRRKTLRVVYDELFAPLTYTSLTTGLAFLSLALTPIPPVRVFGIFVAIGVALAWLLTLAFIPAYIMTLSEERLQATLARPRSTRSSLVGTTLRSLGRFTVRRPVAVVGVFAAIALLAAPGLTQIAVNDNPVRWFKAGTEVRQASEVLNDKLPGTFNASLVLDAATPDLLLAPDTVAAVADLQAFWATIDVVGATSSYADVVTGNSRPEIEASLGNASAAHGPLVASLITADASFANLRLQMNDGDSQAMRDVVDRTDQFLAARPLPAGIDAGWAGETYLNLVWQDEMVQGMLLAFLSTLAVVVVLMVALFRSVRWALFGVIPVLWTVLVLYGAIGLIGRDYDAPIAILSTLVLGIGVDFAIHFVQRYRELAERHGPGPEAIAAFFREPARALTRNAIIIAIGFAPLFLSSLVPYLVVGALLSSLMILSWLATMLVLPALVALGNRHPGPTKQAPVPRREHLEEAAIS